ncbi:cation-transporting ATPase E [Aequitasia blattaphilus]|uniref:Cation-translocating P-type ATPase n=1 Tax=Aequitasia blattaphilus TaxID=2949332 RepID=A0ABT1EAP7_9FIRM|nr:cation-translocating P-type ATPase [Aequitasia blattaphilus]MCP1102882.1 cation-translocating P-type ATPase [Aequitasia blattaphilus]MCR8615522.1 cation-translocating P-type ATPase [Aequitasia blattaphilus]
MKKAKRKVVETNLIRRRDIQRTTPDTSVGLCYEEVQVRKENGWENTSVEPPSPTTKEIIKSNTFTYFNLIFLVLAILLILVGSFRNLTFLPIIITNTLIGIIQELKAKKTLDELSMLNAPTTTVIREGERKKIPSEQLVIDEIVVFQAGNQISADGKVVEGEVQVNESLLTGEADEIVKKPGDKLLSGSFVTSGECKGILENVGRDSYISKLTLEAKAMPKGEQSEMMRSLNKLLKIVGILIIPIGLILLLQGFFVNHESVRDNVTSMVAALIGMIPEGLYLLTSVALAVSSIRLASKKVLLHDMKSIETLARVDVLCVDKTGTITENVMKVQKVVVTKNFKAKTMGNIVEVIGDFALAMGDENITMHALKEKFSKGTGKTPVSTTPFSSSVKYSGATFSDAAYVLGAPEFTLRGDYKEYKETIEKYAGMGYRVLVFGTYEGTLDGKALVDKVIPLAFILLANPVRKAAPETFRYFEEQGVEIKVISGDNPKTVSEVARKACIRHADKVVDAKNLHTYEEIEDAILKNTVFGHVTPAQKRQFVQALKANGRTVAMTGDGVNDVLALKDADCSVAMASGSDAAAQASQLVLLESDFSRMPEVVLEGRRVVNNIQRSASLFLVKNIFSLLLALFSMASAFTYPLEPSQISLISTFTIGLPAFFLALLPNKEIIKGQFLPNVLLKALPGGLTDVLIVAAMVVFGKTFGVSPSDIGTASTMLLSIVGFMILFSICKPMNKIRLGIFAGSIVGLLFSSYFLPDLFAITEMSRECIMLFVIFSIATEPMLRYLTLLISKIKSIYRLSEERSKKKIRRKSI